FPRLWEERGVQEMRLGPLTRRASERLVRDALGDATTMATCTELYERSGGNAFYLEELVRAVAAGQGDRLPDTVVAMVQARLDALEPDARRALRAGAVFGQVFWRDGVAALLGAAPGDREWDEWLDALVEREVLAARGEQRFRAQ